MRNVYIVTGRITGPTSVELDEPLDELDGEVEVMVQVTKNGHAAESVFDFLRNLPPGTRTKEDIDQQIREERDSWGETK